MKKTNIKELGNILKGNYTLRQKANYLKYAFAAKSERLSYKPVTLSIVPTGKCTLSCDMCPTHSRVIPDSYEHTQKTTKDMTFEMFKKVVDRFPEAITISIIGSCEPLLNNDFFRMTEYAAKKYKISVKTFTNGTTLDKENIKRILDSSLDGVTVSLNSHNADDYARLTGMEETVYNGIQSGIRELISARNAINSPVKVKVSFIVDRQNYKSINKMIYLASGLGADTIFLCNFLPSPFEGFMPEERGLFCEDKEMRSFLNDCREGLPPSLKKKVKWPVLISKNKKSFNCSCHFSQLRVDGEGSIGSCSMMLLNMTGNGNISDKEIWNNDFFIGMRRKFSSGIQDNVPKQCLSCPDNCGMEI